MDLFQEAKKLINETKNIYILPSTNNQDDSIPTSLALFYILKKLKKNVNLIVEKFPEKFHFLIPSLNFISEPKNFVISIPASKGEVSQIQYEKSEEGLKIYLTLDKGNIKKNDISFSFNISKPDLLITVGNKNLLPNQNFSIEGPILNIDNQILLDKNYLTPLENQRFLTGQAEQTSLGEKPLTEQAGNKNFSQVNLIKSNSSLAEIVSDFLKSVNEDLIEKNISTCLLTGIIVSSENFQNRETSVKTFETAAFLVKKGASHQQIIDELYPDRDLFFSRFFKNSLTPLETNPLTERAGLTPNSVHKSKSLPQNRFLSKIFQNLRFEPKKGIPWAILDSSDFQDFTNSDANLAIEQLKTNFWGLQNLLVLWKGHASIPLIKGFFYSEKTDLIKKILEVYQGSIKNNNVFFSIKNSELEIVKDKVLKTLIS